MGNISQDWKMGNPGVGISKWPKGTVVKSQVIKREDGRWLAQISLNGADYFSLPGSFPVEVDAQITLSGYIAENLDE